METKFFVPSIKCDGCVTAIKDGLKHLNGVISCQVYKDGRVVEVSHANSLSDSEIRDALKSIGYPAI